LPSLPSQTFRRKHMIIIAGWLQVDRADRERYVAGCVTVMRQARTSPGCLDFAITADPVEPDRINVYERWESDADLQRFRGEGPDADQAAQIRDASVRKYRISAIEDP
ncbi:MAG TPA: antibiotic biosynthesis monooxygenase family protein, partial [Pseudonocardiaceae bacterium]|nr:antibiotic biosynthesis monooxygenase family protein [Pseudonocardiaceae bacterium]